MCAECFFSVLFWFWNCVFSSLAYQKLKIITRSHILHVKHEPIRLLIFSVLTIRRIISYVKMKTGKNWKLANKRLIQKYLFSGIIIIIIISISFWEFTRFEIVFYFCENYLDENYYCENLLPVEFEKKKKKRKRFEKFQVIYYNKCQIRMCIEFPKKIFGEKTGKIWKLKKHEIFQSNY